jgi:hypothetical protein
MCYCKRKEPNSFSSSLFAMSKELSIKNLFVQNKRHSSIQPSSVLERLQHRIHNKKYEIFGRISEFHNMTIRLPTHRFWYGLCFRPPPPENTPVSVGIYTASTVIWSHVKCSSSITRQVPKVENIQLY